MVTEKIKQLQALQAKASELQKSIESERAQELAGLPERYGYDSLDSFVRALKDANGTRGRRGRRPAAKRASAPAAAKGGRKRKRAKITPEMKQQVKEAVAAGKTGAAIAKEFGISVPSVQNIKKELGLVKARG